MELNHSSEYIHHLPYSKYYTPNTNAIVDMNKNGGDANEGGSQEQ